MQGCRQLTSSDIDWIVEELRDLPKSSKVFEDVPDDPVYVRLALTSWMRQGLFGVCAPDKSSFLLAHKHTPWYANRTEIAEVILWVPERYRGGRTALKLVKGFTELALDYDPYCITAGVSLDITSKESTLRLYEMLGYTRLGENGVIMRP